MRFATVISIVLVIWAHYSRPSLADFRSSLATGRLRSIIPPTLAHLSPSFLVDWLDAMLYVPPLAGGNVADADVEFSDGWVATYASVGVSVIRSKERRQHFLGLFGAWLPVPGGLVSLVRGTGVVDMLDAQRCSWKGLPLSGSCVCLPSYTPKDDCSRRVSGAITLYTVLRSATDDWAVLPSEWTRPLLMHPLLHSVLTATTLLEFMLFATWFMYALHWIPGIASALYRNACFGGGPGTSTSFSLFRLHAPLLCHFNHRHFIHALWSTYVLYMYVAPLYHDMGGADFHRFVAALWVTLAAWKWAVDTLLSPSAPIHGLQYVGFACAVADLLLRRPSFLAGGAVSMFVGHAAFDMWKDLLRMVLQQTFFAQFLVGAVDWRMYLGAIVSPMVYLVVRSA